MTKKIIITCCFYVSVQTMGYCFSTDEAGSEIDLAETKVIAVNQADGDKPSGSAKRNLTFDVTTLKNIILQKRFTKFVQRYMLDPDKKNTGDCHRRG